jgi:hypothetical protein
MYLQMYLAKYEHLALQLSCSSCQPLALQQLLAHLLTAIFSGLFVVLCDVCINILNPGLVDQPRHQCCSRCIVTALMYLQLYLANYEHLPMQLSRSSCQPLALQQLLALADSPLQQQWQQLELGYPPNIGSLQLRQVSERL